MKRNHIHFAPDVPGGQEIISGMLLYSVCVCVVCVHMHKCLCMYNTIL